MSAADIHVFLSMSEALLPALAREKHIYSADFQGRKYFAETNPGLFRLLCHVASPEAIAAIEKVSANAFWFLITAGTAVALAEGMPAREEDVSRAICLQRRLSIGEPGSEALRLKVSGGNFNLLSEAELADAGKRCFILLQECGVEGPSFLFNPLLV
jgi:hypothetical protein